MQYDDKILEEKFKALPEELQVALTSVKIANAVKEIGVKNGLRIDQEEVLYDLTAYVMLGLSPSKDFMRNLSREAGIDEKTALAVATDINNEIFAKIRSSMQAVEEREESLMGTSVNPDQARFNQAQTDQAKLRSDISSVEKAGGFSIEMGGNGNVESSVDINGNGVKNMMRGEEGIRYGDRDEILGNIEDPEEIMGKKSGGYLGPTMLPENTDVIVDHLLANPAATTEEKIIHHTAPPPDNLPGELGTEKAPKTELSSSVSRQPQKPKGPDLYREPIK